jgi:hypothetical protein
MNQIKLNIYIYIATCQLSIGHQLEYDKEMWEIIEIASFLGDLFGNPRIPCQLGVLPLKVMHRNKDGK